MKDRYLTVVCDSPVLMMLRLPEHRPPWKLVLKAFNAVRKEHGLSWRSVYALEPASQPNAGDFNARLARAFDGDLECLPEFRLYDWKDGVFALARAAVGKDNAP